MEKREGEKKKINKNKLFLYFFETVVLTISIILLIIYICGDHRKVFIIFSSIAFIIVAAFIYWGYIEEEKSEKTYSELEKYLLSERTKEWENEKERIERQDVLAFMQNNTKEIKEYFQISKKQERVSYYVSIICAIFGFFMLLGAVFAVFLDSGIETTVISIVSGSITEVISGIVLWIHNKSAMQLNYYYDALHENEKFLSAINLADKLEDEKKEQMYMEIIRSQISMSGDRKAESQEESEIKD